MDLAFGLRKALGGANFTATPQEMPINPAEVMLATGVRDFIDSVTGASWMGPNQPMAPIAPQGTLPRTMDYPFGSNLYFQPRQEQPGSPDFQQLRMLARYDIVRLCIETRKAQILEMPWQFRLKQEQGESKKQHAKRSDGDDRIEELNEFFKMPDHEHGFLDWMNMIVEEILVTDALSIWPVLGQDRKPISLRLIDGGTIKPLHDPQGWRPNPPNPAFQQIVKGSPAINMTAGLCMDCVKHGYHDDPRTQDKKGYCLPLVYKPFNPTVDRFYGWSPTEQVLHTIMIGMNRMVSQMSLYTEGNIPEAVVSVPADWGLEQIKQFQAWFDQLAGNVSVKSRVRFLPGESKFVQTKDPMIKDERDDWIARVCCYAYSVAPNALVKQMNRASSQQIQASAIEEGKLPTLGRISELINFLIHSFFGSDYKDIEHVYDTDQQSDPAVQAKIDDMKLRNGSKKLNEVREDEGDDPLPNGDRSMIYLPTGPIFLDDVGKEPEPSAGGPGMPPGMPPFGSQTVPSASQAPGKGKLPFGKPGRATASLSAKGGKPAKGEELSPEAQKEARKLLKMIPAKSALGNGNGNGHHPVIY